MTILKQKKNARKQKLVYTLGQGYNRNLMKLQNYLSYVFCLRNKNIHPAMVARMGLFQRYRGESSLKLFILILHILISVPDAFCSYLIFENLNLFKFCTKFPRYAYVTAFFILRKHWFVQFRILEGLSWMCSKPRTCSRT